MPTEYRHIGSYRRRGLSGPPESLSASESPCYIYIIILYVFIQHLCTCKVTGTQRCNAANSVSKEEIFLKLLYFVPANAWVALLIDYANRTVAAMLTAVYPKFQKGR
jgi:hypothetical protein